MTKPLGHKSYTSIGHLPGSRMNSNLDHLINPGQAKICTVAQRDKHDFIIVQEKLDGSNVAICNIDEKYHFNVRGFGEAEFVNYTGQKYVAVLKDNVVFAKNVETGVTRRMMNSRSSKIVSCQNTGMHDISVVYADGVVIVWNPLTDRMQQLL